MKNTLTEMIMMMYHVIDDNDDNDNDSDNDNDNVDDDDNDNDNDDGWILYLLLHHTFAQLGMFSVHKR